MKNPVKISMFAVLFAIIALPVIAQQGGGVTTPARVANPSQVLSNFRHEKGNVQVTPDFEKKLWCEVVHKSYNRHNIELNPLNDAMRDRTFNRLYELGFRLKNMSTASYGHAEGWEPVVQTSYFFERANIR